MKNIRITVSSVDDTDIREAQVYSNYGGITTGTISLMVGKGKTMPPEIGNFPHVSGHNQPVKILHVEPTDDEDNAGVDVSEILERYKELK